MEKLQKIQTELKAPKWQFNAFGKYKYRNVEDIMESVKPLLEKYKCLITMSDEIVMVWDRYYIKATVSIQDTENKWVISTVWYAREEETKKWMDWSQITWSSSSYARKYALNWLLAIDDTKDSDHTNEHKEEKPEFTEEKFNNFKKWTDWKHKWEINEYLPKLKEKYKVSDEIAKRIDLFVNAIK